MEPRDCTWCGSARSIEHGVCQVCLMRLPDLDTADERVVVVLEDRGTQAREADAGDEAPGTAVAD